MDTRAPGLFIVNAIVMGRIVRIEQLAEVVEHALSWCDIVKSGEPQHLTASSIRYHSNYFYWL